MKSGMRESKEIIFQEEESPLENYLNNRELLEKIFSAKTSINHH